MIDEIIEFIYELLSEREDGLPNDRNDIFDSLTDSGIDLSQLSPNELDTLIEALKDQGIDINSNDSIDNEVHDIEDNGDFTTEQID